MAAMLSAPLFFGCGGQNRQKIAKRMDADTIKTICTQVKLQKDSLLATLMFDGMKVTWIRDNVSERLMPRALFPDATDALMDGFSLQNGVPASISTFLVESEGKRIHGFALQKDHPEILRSMTWIRPEPSKAANTICNMPVKTDW